jgi:hypothetical protein
MDDPSNIPDSDPAKPAPEQAGEISHQPSNDAALPSGAELTPKAAAICFTLPETPAAELHDRTATRRRNFLRNLYLLLPLTLAAFSLTAWILIRMDSPFGIFSSGPQEIVRAQLLALDRGELRPAYDMFSERYRGQVSFDDWHELIVTHWRMFHAEVLHSEVPSSKGPGIALELFLHGDDDRDYRARFTLIHAGGRWWIDDVHWTVEPDQRDVSRT